MSQRVTRRSTGTANPIQSPLTDRRVKQGVLHCYRKVQWKTEVCQLMLGVGREVKPGKGFNDRLARAWKSVTRGTEMETDIRPKSLADKYRALEAGTVGLVAGKKDRSNTKGDKLRPQTRRPPPGASAERVEQLPSLERTYRDVVIHHTVRNERSEQAPGTAMCNRRAAKSSPLERIVEVGPPQRSSAVRCTKTVEVGPPQRSSAVRCTKTVEVGPPQRSSAVRCTKTVEVGPPQRSSVVRCTKTVEVGPPKRSSAVRCTKTGLLNQAGGDVKHCRPGLGHRVNPNQKQSWKSKPPPPPRAVRPTSDQARGR